MSTERRLKDLIEKMAEVLNGLCCPECGGQGRGLAKVCCKDADCNAGWYGVPADEIKALLDDTETLLPGTVTRLESRKEENERRHRCGGALAGPPKCRFG
jgi:hypothetical protein